MENIDDTPYVKMWCGCAMFSPPNPYIYQTHPEATQISNFAHFGLIWMALGGVVYIWASWRIFWLGPL